MKNVILFLLIIGSFISQSQPIDRSFESASGRITLLGQVSLERLSKAPFGDWYMENHEKYQVGESPVDLSKADSITIFMGTWCGDSKREVPRFVKILEKENYDMSKLKILCLNTGFQNYKQAPEREERGVNIHRVPTFIFHDNGGSEIGRIVEEPVVSLEADMNTVLSGEPYETAYPVAKRLIEYFDRYSIRELKKMKSKLVDEFGFGQNAYELNTYGYVLWTSFQMPKAQFAFELNAALFPNEAIVHQTLARFMSSLGKNKEAVASVKKGLKAEPENENLLALMSELQE